MHDPNAIPCWQVEEWSRIPGLVHGFYGRRGGVSEGAWASLNLGTRVGDDPAHVRENWRRLCAALRGVTPVTMQQVHGDRIVTVSAAEQSVGEADGMATDVAGIGLSVATADCVPILLVEPTRRISLAVHAGWRGTLAGIAEGAVRLAAEKYAVPPDSLHVAIGPAIGPCCYEVSAAIGTDLEAKFGKMPDAWACHGEHGMLDLRRANRLILQNAGVPAARISEVGPCTSCHSDVLYSHRRSGGRTGRQISIIGFISP